MTHDPPNRKFRNPNLNLTLSLTVTERDPDYHRYLTVFFRGHVPSYCMPNFGKIGRVDFAKFC